MAIVTPRYHFPGVVGERKWSGRHVGVRVGNEFAVDDGWGVDAVFCEDKMCFVQCKLSSKVLERAIDRGSLSWAERPLHVLKFLVDERVRVWEIPGAKKPIGRRRLPWRIAIILRCWIKCWRESKLDRIRGGLVLDQVGEIEL